MKRVLKWLFALAGIASSLYCLVYFGNWDAFTLPSLRLSLALVGLFALEIVSRAWRIKRTGLLAGKRLSFWDACWINALGDVFGAITPSGMGGEVSRLAGLVRLGVSTRDGIKAFAAERFALLVAMGILIAVMGAGLLATDPHSLGLPSFRYTVFLYLGGLAAAIVVAVGLIRTKKIHLPWRTYLWKPDLFALALLHHLIRVGLLPLLVFAFTKEPSHALAGPIAWPVVWVWSLVLCYGLSLLPVPSGGGAIEFAFATGLSPLLGPLTPEILVLWRLNGFYLYVVSGAIVTFIGSFQRRASATKRA